MLYYEHLELLDAAKDRAANLQLQAGWANGSWCQVTSATLALLTDEAVLKQLGFKNADRDDSKVRENAELFFQLVCATASKRTWSMSVYDLPGKSFAGLLDSDLFAASRSLEQCRSDRDAVQRAVELQHDRDRADAEADRLIGAKGFVSRPR